MSQGSLFLSTTEQYVGQMTTCRPSRLYLAIFRCLKAGDQERLEDLPAGFGRRPGGRVQKDAHRDAYDSNVLGCSYATVVLPSLLCLLYI